MKFRQVYRNHCLSFCLSVQILAGPELFLVLHWLTIFGTWVYHQEKMWQVHSWSWYDIDHWPPGQINRFYDMVLCSGLSFFVLQQSHFDSHSSVSPWYDVSHTFMNSVWPWPLTSISKLIFSPWIWDWQDVFALWHRHTKFWHLVVTCCVHSWP